MSLINEETRQWTVPSQPRKKNIRFCRVPSASHPSEQGQVLLPIEHGYGLEAEAILGFGRLGRNWHPEIGGRRSLLRCAVGMF